MHSARQQAILTALGIRQWVPRATVTTSVPAVTLWRQAADLSAYSAVEETDPDAIQSEAGPVISGITAAPALSTPEQHIHTDQAATIQHKLATSEFEQEQVIAGEQVLQETAFIELEQSATPMQSFRLQACEINQWIVLVNEADLQNPLLSILWKNILLAFRQSDINHFSWPLSEGQRWQRMTGSKAALNGFLFRMGLDKRVGLMSDLADEMCPDRIERLPHLSELLEQPLKKRLLWQLLKNQ